jgi:hypothetical protein
VSIIRALAFGLVLAGTAVPSSAQESIDWFEAEKAFQSSRADRKKIPKGRGASTCAAYWLIYSWAVKGGDIPQEALDVLDPEISSLEEANLNVVVFLARASSNPWAYRNAKAAAEKRMAKLLVGDKKELKTYFVRLGKCSFGPA